MTHSFFALQKNMESSFEVHFGSIEDPRTGNATRHLLSDLIGLVVIAILCRAEGWEEIEEFGKAKEPFLRKVLCLSNGIPSHDTLERVFKRLSPKHLEECFRSWVAGLGFEHEHISLDGKSLRGSGDGYSGKTMVHMVSAWASGAGISLGQETVDCKENEHKAMLRILDMLDLCGCLVTIDAMGNQRKIAEKIIAGEGDYLTGLKDNQPTILEETEALFNSIGPESSHTEYDKGHGRIEKRTCHVIYQVDMLDPLHDWPGLKALVKVESEISKGDKKSTQNRFYLSSKHATAREFNTAARNHWSIENSQHWILDVQFHEDLCRKRKDNAAENFAILRRLALNILNQDKTPRLSTNRKRMKASWDENYLIKLLGFLKS